MALLELFWVKAKQIASEAEREAAVFHQRLAAGQYDATYDHAAPAFQASLNRSDSAKFFMEETMTYVATGDGPRLVNYNANSPVFVMK